MHSREQLVEVVAGHLHAEQKVDAARCIAEFSGKSGKLVDSENAALEWCNSLLYWNLNNDHYDWAANMLWNERLFSYKPRATKMVWEAVASSSSLLLMGAASMSKSYSVGAWLLLDWIRDPEYTSVNLVGPSEDHLKDNLFTHMVTMHSQATLPLPGKTGDLFIGLDPRKRKGAIRGIIIPLGKKPSGRIQGRKRVPRKYVHPKLGTMSRMRVFMDELEKIPQGVWKDVDNVFANLDSDPDGFKIMGAFNPEDPNGPVAERCEPEKGWEAFDPDHDEQWVSKRGWNVLRLDAAKCENVVEQKVIYPGLQSYEGFQRIISNSGGVDTPGYWTMARACFPRGGAVYCVISSLLVSRMRGEFIFGEEPVNCAAADLALEGNDAAEMATGRFGKAVGFRFYPSLEHPQGGESYFKDPNGKRRLRWALQVDQIFQLKKGDTVFMAQQIKDNCIRMAIPPGMLMLDRTGNGAGVHDLLKALWSQEVRGLNYTQAATEMKIVEEDTKTALEEYERAVSELWFALKKWAEFNFVRVGAGGYSEELNKQLTGRRYSPGKITRVESKPDYKSRGNASPNKADALTLLLHGVRVATRCVPSALDDCAGTKITGESMWRGEMPSWVGHTDVVDCIEDDREPEDGHFYE